MERIIVFSESVKTYLNELVDILYYEDYFSFKKDARFYVEHIVVYIENYDFKVNVKDSPEKFQKFGKKYLRYKANNQTFWYVFFDEKDTRILINHISNNHSQNFADLL